MFVKLVSRKQCLIPHFEPQATDSRAEMVGVFLARVCGLVSGWATRYRNLFSEAACFTDLGCRTFLC